jgi:hypothetical protein
MGIVGKNRRVSCAVLAVVLCGGALGGSTGAETRASLAYAGYFGGSGGEYNVYIAVDGAGNVILAGHTYSWDFPTSANALQPDFTGGPCDAFVAKFTPDMTKVIFSTCLGGSAYDEIKAVTVDEAGDVFVTGITESEDFPVTPNALDRSHNGSGGFDAFLTELSPEGKLVYSTYLGGVGNDYGMGVSAASSRAVYLTGSTESGDFPGRSGGRAGGKADLFIMEIDLGAGKIMYASFIGGSGDESPLDIARDKAGCVYVCGSTDSPDFPLKAGLGNAYKGKTDGFIVKLDAAGGLAYSSLIGGAADDIIVDVDVNDRNEVCFTGGSASPGLACSSNALSSSLKGGSDAILGKTDSDGKRLSFFSYFGGDDRDNLFDVNGFPYCFGSLRILSGDVVAVCGTTMQPGVPVTPTAFDTEARSFDIFVSLVDVAKGDLLYSTYLGGYGDDNAFDMAVRAGSTIYVSGQSSSTSFPTTPDAVQKRKHGEANAVFACLKLSGTR